MSTKICSKGHTYTVGRGCNVCRNKRVEEKRQARRKRDPEYRERFVARRRRISARQRAKMTAEQKEELRIYVRDWKRAHPDRTKVYQARTVKIGRLYVGYCSDEEVAQAAVARGLELLDDLKAAHRDERVAQDDLTKSDQSRRLRAR